MIHDILSLRCLNVGVQPGQEFKSTLSLGHVHFVPQHIPGAVLINQAVDNDIGEGVPLEEERLNPVPAPKDQELLGSSSDSELSSDEVNVNPAGIIQVAACYSCCRCVQL